MIFDAKDLEYDISKDRAFRCNNQSYSARSGLGLGLECSSNVGIVDIFHLILICLNSSNHNSNHNSNPQ